MISEKLDQVKLAMEKILMHDLGSENFFSIITFNNTVKVKHQSNFRKNYERFLGIEVINLGVSDTPTDNY